MAYYSKFNGYEVKDKSAREGIEYLTEVVSKLDTVVNHIKDSLSTIEDNDSSQNFYIEQMRTTMEQLEEDLGNVIVPDRFVASVNGETGDVTLDAEKVGALPDTTPIPTKMSDLVQDIELGFELPLSVENGGTGGADGYNAFTSLGLKLCSASGVVGSSEVLLTGQPTVVPLSRFVAQYQKYDNSNEYYPFELTDDGGIKVNERGFYLISGSSYIKIPTTNTINNVGRCVQIYKRDTYNGTETEINQAVDTIYSGGLAGGITTGLKLVPLVDGDIIYLKARTMNCDGTVYNGNEATYLTIIGLPD